MQSSVDPSAQVAASAKLGPACVVSAGAVIGEGCRLGPFVFIDEGVVVGADTVIEAHCVILRGTVIGQRCHFSSGCVLGSQGFGFVEHDGVHHHIPQVGGVEIGDDTHFGPSTCVDRGTMKPTRIGNRCKIGAQVQVAHNVQIGDDSVLEDQVGMAGSCVVGQCCHLGPQSGLAGSASLGDNCTLGARAGLTRKVPANTDMWGFPARPKAEAQRNVAALSLLTKMFAKEGKLSSSD